MVMHYMTKEVAQRLGHLLDKDLTEDDMGEMESLANELISEAEFDILVNHQQPRKVVKGYKIHYRINPDNGYVDKTSIEQQLFY